VKDKRSRVSRSGNKTREYKDGRREGEGSVRLANIQVCQGHTEVFRTSKLLLPVH